MIQIGKILGYVATQLADDVAKSIINHDRDATGETIREIEVIEREDSALLVAPDYIEDLEFGKKPGERSDLSRLDAWINARGLDFSPQRLDNLLFARGYEGRKGVLSEPLSEKNIDNRLNDDLGQIANFIVVDILESIK